MAENTINDFNTLPEQVQINKEDIETLNAKIDTITSNIANLGWELKTDTIGNKSYIPKNFDENIPYSLTNITDSTQASGLNIYKDTDGYVWSYLSIYIPSENDFVGIWTGHDNTDGYFCTLSMATPNDKTTYLVVTYIANSDCPQSLNKDTYKEDLTIATMGWVNKYYLTETDASNTYLTKTDASNTYAKKSELNNDYLKKSDASNTYLTKSDASNTYVTIQDYDERFDTGNIALTTEGFNKIKTMAEKEGTTITLIATTDFNDNIQVSNTHELILSVYYNGNPIYRNIHLIPNQTTDNYTAYQNTTESTYYTGHAMLNLPSQDYGYFAISYLNNTTSQLILTLIAHY